MAGHGITVILYIVTLVEEEKKKNHLTKFSISVTLCQEEA